MRWEKPEDLKHKAHVSFCYVFQINPPFCIHLLFCIIGKHQKVNTAVCLFLLSDSPDPARTTTNTVSFPLHHPRQQSEGPSTYWNHILRTLQMLVRITSSSFSYIYILFLNLDGSKSLSFGNPY